MATCTLNSGTAGSSGGNSGYQLAVGATGKTASGPWSASPGYPYKVTSVSVPWFGYTTGGTLSISGTVTVTIKSGSTTIGSLSGSVSSTIYSNTNTTSSVSCTGTVNCTSGTSYTLTVSCSGSNLLKSGVRFTTNGKSLTVNYSAQTYTVSYNANGHGSAPASQTKTAGTTLTLQPYIATNYSSESTVVITGNKNGATWSGSNGSAKWRYTYTQGGWNTNSAGTGTNYGSKGSYTANAAATLYAKWSSSAGGTSYTLPTGTPSKAATTSSSLTVTFNPNGGSTTKTSQTSVKTTTYSFKGWFTASSGGTQRTTASRVTAAETVYAQFNSSTSGQGAVTCPTAAQCTKAGYSLLGWSTSSTATSATYGAGGSYTPSSNITLYAVWGNPTLYNINLITNGGSFDITPVDGYSETENTISNWSNFKLSIYNKLAKFKDGYFSNGQNNISSYAYNQSGTSANASSTITRVTDKSSDNPFSNTTYEINAALSKGAYSISSCRAGWVQTVTSHPNETFLHLFVAKVPSGYTLNYASNSTGDGSTVEWLTPQAGTGTFEVYAYRRVCGASGTFSTSGHVYIYSANSFSINVRIAYSEVFSSVISVPYNSLITDLPIPKRSGYKLASWAGKYVRANQDYCNYGRGPMYPQFSIYMKIYKEDWSTMNNNERPISCTEGGGYSLHYAEPYSGSKVWQFEIYDSTTSSYRYCTTTIDPKTLKGWHDINITFDGHYIRFYLDGELNMTSPQYNAIKYATSNNLFIGAESGGTSPDPGFDAWFDGYIGNVTFYNNANPVIGTNQMLTVPAQDQDLYACWERANHIKVKHNNEWHDVPIHIYYNNEWQPAMIKTKINDDWEQP